MASKFLAEFPFLGKKSSKSSSLQKTAPWIAALSKGGLVIPSQSFMSQIYDMEQIFNRKQMLINTQGQQMLMVSLGCSHGRVSH